MLSIVEGEVLGTRFIEELLTLVDTAPDSTTYLTAEQEPNVQTEADRLAQLNPRIRRATGDPSRH